MRKIIMAVAQPDTPENIIAYRPSDHLEQRLSDLLERNQQEYLTADERAELEEFLRMNHFMNMLKIRARQRVTHD
jgi:hypothetical protein